jgi:putative ABC transport system permease protein
MKLQLTLAFRYLNGRKLRTFLTTLAIMFGVLVISSMNTILPTMLTSLQANAMAAGGNVDVTITNASGDAFPQDIFAKVQAVEGLRAISPSLNRTINLPADFYDHNPGKTDTIRALALVGIDPYLAKTVRAFPLMAGRYLEEGDTASALISQTLADSLSVKVGDKFTIPSVTGTTELSVVGLLIPNIGPGNEEVVVTLPEAQMLTGQPGKITKIDVDLNTTDVAAREQTISRITAALGDSYKIGSQIPGEEFAGTFKIAQAAFNLFGVLALFMGAFIIFNTFRTVVTERRRDIGMLRAIGASRRTILGMILAESLLQGIVGSVAGLLLGYLFSLGGMKLAEPIMNQFINLKLGNPVVTPWIVAVSIFLGVGVTVLAGLIPAFNASKVTPLDALRPSVADVEFVRRTGRRFVAGVVLIVLAVLAIISGNVALIAPGSIIFLIGLVLVAPALVSPIAKVFGGLLTWVYARQGIGELAESNLTRQPSRAAITASSTMLALAIIVAAGGLVSSLTITMSDLLSKNLGSDYLFIPPSISVWSTDLGAGQGFADQLRAVNGVADVSTLRFASSALDGTSVSILGIDPIVYPKVSGLHFMQGNASAYRSLAAGRNMIVNGSFLAATDTKFGDTVELATPNGKATYTIVAVATDLLDQKVSTAFISQTNLQADFGKTEDVFLQLNLKPGADDQAAGARIKAIAANYPQFRVVAGHAYVAQMKSLMKAAFAGMYFIMALLALPSLIAMLNTLAIGVIERTREIGMLRAVGTTRKQVYNMVLVEAILLAAVGTAFGLLAGLYLGFIFVISMAVIFPLGYTFPLTGILAAIAIGLLFGVIAALIPARQAASMDIVKALRYE